MPRIALVDDDRNVLTSVSIALEAEGYRVATYTGGDTALDVFESYSPTWPFSILRCRAWTVWRCCADSAQRRTYR